MQFLLIERWKKLFKDEESMESDQNDAQITESKWFPTTFKTVRQRCFFKLLVFSYLLIITVAFIMSSLFLIYKTFIVETKESPVYISELEKFLKVKKVPFGHKLKKRSIESSIENLTVSVQGNLSSMKERVRDTLLNDSMPINNAEQQAIFLLLSERLEPIIGQNNELLVWYYRNKDFPKFEIKNDKLKVSIAKLLYSTKMMEYAPDVNILINLIIDDTFLNNFNNFTSVNLVNRNKTYIQDRIIDRLLMKRYVLTLLDPDINVLMMVDPTLNILFDSLNLVDIRKLDVDPDTFESKH